MSKPQIRFPQFQRRLRDALCFTLAILIAGPATAGSIRFDRDGLNARSSLSFRGTGNVITTVPKGTTGDVLERWELPSGNFGVKLKITKVGSVGTTLKEGEEIWVYYHKDADLRRVAVLDDEGQEKTIDDPSGKWAVALSSFRTRRQEKKEEPCVDCGVGKKDENGADPVIVEQPLVNGHEEVADSAEEVLEAVNDAPLMELSEQEMLAYINSITENYGKNMYEVSLKRKRGSMSQAEFAELKAKQKKYNPIIAKTMVEECKKRGVPIELGLSLMKAESEFVIDAKSYVGARGLMQLMPTTYDGLRAAAGHGKDAGRSQIADPVLNIQLGVKYLAELLKRYKGNHSYAVGAYNAGPGNMDKYLRGKKRLKRETINHMAKIKTYKANYAAYVKKSKTLIASN